MPGPVFLVAAAVIASLGPNQTHGAEAWGWLQMPVVARSPSLSLEAAPVRTACSALTLTASPQMSSVAWPEPQLLWASPSHHRPGQSLGQRESRAAGVVLQGAGRGQGPPPASSSLPGDVTGLEGLLDTCRIK